MAVAHCIVTGRVQGVGYRRFVEREARSLGLTGTVRNRADGGVETLAEGPPAALRTFVQALERGPLAARVEEVRVDWSEDPPRHRDFRVV